MVNKINKFSVVFGVVMFCVTCQTQKKHETCIVATNAWTAAYAKAAGADSFAILAPIEMTHPTEYELRPSDIKLLYNANVIVYAGFEAMSKELQTNTHLTNKLINIDPSYYFSQIQTDVMKIASVIGKDSIAQVNLNNIKNLFDDGRIMISELELSKEVIIAHHHLLPFLKELGLEPKAIFSALSPESATIYEMAKLKPSLIIDNHHNPTGKVFHSLHPEARYIEFLNFPGYASTSTLQDVILYNIKQIQSIRKNDEDLL